MQLLLPLYDNTGLTFPQSQYVQVGKELTDRFGGLTAFTRSPAAGLWKEDDDHTVRDDVIVYEVMADHLDREWWAHFRATLCELFRQEEMIVRAQHIELL